MCILHRFTQIQHKSKTIGEDELVRKHRMLSFDMERRPEVAASLLLNQVCIKRLYIYWTVHTVILPVSNMANILDIGFTLQLLHSMNAEIKINFC